MTNNSNFHQNQDKTQPKGHPRKVSPNTVEQYFKFIKILRRAFNEQYPNRQQDVSPSELVDFLYTNSHKYRPKTFINYRCALIYWLNTQASSPDVLHAKLILHENLPRSGFKPHREGAPPASLYSSRSQRKRTFRKRDLDKLIAELNARTHAAQNDKRMNVRANQLLLWIHAGLASGLRPAEWESAHWHDESKGELLVYVAKTKWDTPALPSLAGTEPPKPRTRIVTVDIEDRLWVEQHMQSVAAHLASGEPFTKFYNNNRIYLWHVCNDIFPNRPSIFTLYALRGQFAANRKKLKSLDEVAEEMGCAPQKAGTYYGKASHAHNVSGRQRHLAQDNEALAQKPVEALVPKFTRDTKTR